MKEKIKSRPWSLIWLINSASRLKMNFFFSKNSNQTLSFLASVNDTKSKTLSFISLESEKSTLLNKLGNCQASNHEYPPVEVEFYFWPKLFMFDIQQFWLAKCNKGWLKAYFVIMMDADNISLKYSRLEKQSTRELKIG